MVSFLQICPPKLSTNFLCSLHVLRALHESSSLMITRILFEEEYKSRSFPLWNFLHYSITSFTFGPSILLWISLCFSNNFPTQDFFWLLSLKGTNKKFKHFSNDYLNLGMYRQTVEELHFTGSRIAATDLRSTSTPPPHLRDISHVMPAFLCILFSNSLPLHSFFNKKPFLTSA
jgi:hypothetical protein